jgi:RND family efflux transporter MFP subunit
MKVMFLAKRPPEKAEEEFKGHLVEVIRVSAENLKIGIRGTGTVQARREAEIAPQVEGKVVYTAAQLFVGGLFKKDEQLFAIEKQDYVLALEQAEAELIQAELDLTTMESRAKIARQEWEKLDLAGKGEPNPLVLFVPQMQSAKAKVKSARARVKRAELDLQRTRIAAPFNCRVRSKNLAVGQLVRVGNSVVKVVGTDSVEILLPLSLEDFTRLELPGNNGEKGPHALIRLSGRQNQSRWEGYVDRSIGEVDPRGRMARVAVVVEDPYGLKNKTRNSLDLEIGMFVEVEIEGPMLTNVVPVPRDALRNNSTVWVADKENRLRIRSVEVAWSERERVLIRSGLQEGERVILTTLSGAADGALLRPFEKGKQP